MISVAPIITNEGRALQLSALSGDAIEFTGFKVGSGTLPDGTDAASLTDLIHTEFSFGITSVDDTQDGFITITGSFDNTDYSGKFKWRELGLYCDDADGDNHLYAYANDGDAAGTLNADATDVVLEQTVKVIIAIGDAEHVTAKISASAVYASKSDFDAHTANHNNPHVVTKSQVGLGNVPNVSTNNQTPTYTTDATLRNIVSGETLTIAFGKISKAIVSLIDHIGNKSNPHGVTAAQAGAAAASHTHTLADITDLHTYDGSVS